MTLMIDFGIDVVKWKTWDRTDRTFMADLMIRVLIWKTRMALMTYLIVGVVICKAQRTLMVDLGIDVVI